MDIKVSLLGLVVGFMIGLTGMGGGALMTPALILLGLARQPLAVGTDLVWNALTKGVSTIVHIRQHTVDNNIEKRLAIGSIPGALAGIGLLAPFPLGPAFPIGFSGAFGRPPADCRSACQTVVNFVTKP